MIGVGTTPAGNGSASYSQGRAAVEPRRAVRAARSAQRTLDASSAPGYHACVPCLGSDMSLPSLELSMTTTMSTLTAADREELVSARRDFHQHPELGFEEKRTSARVAERLRE